MAVVSAAVAAVTAAIATTTVATVATAAVAVSALIGTVGLAVTAVGLVTGNKDILKAGKIMGYVGLAGNIAGWAAGSLSMGTNEFAQHVGDLYTQAWDQGVGQWFSPDPSVAAGIEQESLGKGIVAGGNPGYAKAIGAQTDMDQHALGLGIVRTTPMSGHPDPVATTAALPDVSQQAIQTQPPGPSAPGSLSTPASYQAPAAPAAPAAPVSTTPNIGSGLNQIYAGATPVTPSPGESMANFLGRMPDWQKAQLGLVAGQGVVGLASGWMQGLSAEQRLELDKLMNTQNQTQRELINANNSYAPRIAFTNRRAGKGLIHTGGAA